jgi:hypothetical protein
VRDVVDTQGDRSLLEAGVAERTKLANLFAAIGNATNETIHDMPEFSDEGVRRQMMHTFAAVGGFVMYADMLQHSTLKASSQASVESSAAIIQLGRALSRRVEVKDA